MWAAPARSAAALGKVRRAHQDARSRGMRADKGGRHHLVHGQGPSPCPPLIQGVLSTTGAHARLGLTSNRNPRLSAGP